MAKNNPVYRPKNYFLNERHQLAREEKAGGFGNPKFGNIDWGAKGRVVSQSLLSTSRELTSNTRDPMHGKRFFMMAVPSEGVPKISEAKGTSREFVEPIDYKGRAHGKVFGRLGLDLIDVTPDGNALVHARPDVLNQLIATANVLGQTNEREQARWSTIDSFTTIPAEQRVDFTWLNNFNSSQSVDVIFELQPLLSSNEASLVLRALPSFFEQKIDRITGTGTDYSGRQWARGLATVRVLASIAGELFSLQSIHPPLYSKAASRGGSSPMEINDSESTTASGILQVLPTVAVLDNGVPAGHLRLAAYARANQVVPRGAASGSFEDHGSNVASRVVFGEIEENNGLVAGCRYLDVRVSDASGEIHSKTVFEGLAAVAAAFPDVRVFNLSVAIERGIDTYDEESRKEITRLTRELDNFAFDRDVIVVVAAGNGPEGQVPMPPYPNHAGDGRWRLGGWACGFNTFVCGSYVGHPTQGGLGDPNWPSPFTKIGPGLCDCPIPGFSAPGGNTDTHHRMADGMGVLVFDQFGDAVAQIGTSLAAPLLARETAIAMARLKDFCPPGTNAFAATVRSFMALTATQNDITPRIRELAKKTLGYGRASAERLFSPTAGSALIIWQGHISGTDEKVRLLLPIPKLWVETATKPMIRFVVSWDTPVNDANLGVWACRKVELILRPGVAEDLSALHGTRSKHTTYPLIDRLYNLKPEEPGFEIVGDDWVVELSYSEQGMAEYYLGISPDPKHRVGLVAELYDAASENPSSPHSFLQSLPIAGTMNILSAIIQPTPIPISF